jgi:hypothetical protein
MIEDSQVLGGGGAPTMRDIGKRRRRLPGLRSSTRRAAPERRHAWHPVVKEGASVQKF